MTTHAAKSKVLCAVRNLSLPRLTVRCYGLAASHGTTASARPHHERHCWRRTQAGRATQKLARQHQRVDWHENALTPEIHRQQIILEEGVCFSPRPFQSRD